MDARGTNFSMSMMRVDSSFTASSSSLSNSTYSPLAPWKPFTSSLRETCSPVPASTVCMRMRLLVLGLIMLKRMVSASEVAGHRATGQVTSDRRRCPSHDGRAAMLKIPFPNPSQVGTQWWADQFVAAGSTFYGSLDHVDCSTFDLPSLDRSFRQNRI